MLLVGRMSGLDDGTAEGDGLGEGVGGGNGLGEGVAVGNGVEEGVGVGDGLAAGLARPIPGLTLPHAERTIIHERTTVRTIAVERVLTTVPTVLCGGELR
jgi:hypothetical protein